MDYAIVVMTLPYKQDYVKIRGTSEGEHPGKMKGTKNLKTKNAEKDRKS